MKTSDDVFSFTLIDLLLQVCFIVLFLYVLGRADDDRKDSVQKAETSQIREVMDRNGVSNLTELTDELSALGPIKDLKGTADFISRLGGKEKATTILHAVERAGSVDELVAQLERLKKLEDGVGKPPCLYTSTEGKRVPRPLATVTASDSSIVFMAETADLTETLKIINYSYQAIRELPLQEFRKIFGVLLQRRSECRYSLRFIERTSLIHARDAAGSVFYLNIERR